MIKKLTKTIFSAEFYFFAIVGSAGFLVDYSVFSILHCKFDYELSRALSIFTAASFNWLANRTITFKVEKRATHIEWLKYLSVSAVAAAINFSVFIALTRISPLMKEFFVIPMALATGVSMWFNFFCSKFYVFSKK